MSILSANVFCCCERSLWYNIIMISSYDCCIVVWRNAKKRKMREIVFEYVAYVPLLNSCISTRREKECETFVIRDGCETFVIRDGNEVFFLVVVKWKLYTSYIYVTYVCLSPAIVQNIQNYTARRFHIIHPTESNFQCGFKTRCSVI